MTKEVVSSLQVEGIHHWPECPHDDVKYLKTLHRHMFHIKAWKKVGHNDRDTEIIQLKHLIGMSLSANYFDTRYYCLNFGRMSCEDIAEELILEFNLSACEVLEDGENGARLTNV